MVATVKQLLARLGAAASRPRCRGIPDEQVLAFAHALGRVVLTHIRKDFRRLHEAGRAHSGLILCTEDRDVAALGRPDPGRDRG